VDAQGELLEVVAALHPRRRLAHFLHGGQEQADEDGDDGDHHQQLDQREGKTWLRHRAAHDGSSASRNEKVQGYQVINRERLVIVRD
jgi:hypothetical protein